MRTTDQSSDTNWKQIQHDEFGNYNRNVPASTWAELRICMGIPRNTKLFWETYVYSIYIYIYVCVYNSSLAEFTIS